MKSKIVIAVFIATLLSISSAFSQDKVYILEYMYLGNDTLDYSDSGTESTLVSISKINYDSTNKLILFTGKMYRSSVQYPIDSTIGNIFLGEITKIVANTYLGYIETGLIRKQTQFKPDDKGKFSIIVPADTKFKIIFTCFTCNVIEYTLNDLVNLYNK
ncbi:MAG: hypothetical protein PHN88_02455 [Ignavibacteria bacterium]|nr:hypothetical protein [Ignavibacteria bacterium]